MSDILYRLKRLESLIPDRLQVFVELENGTVEKMTVEQFEKTGGNFIRVAEGGSLYDLDRLLDIVVPNSNI